jgi:subtilisin
MSPRRAAGRALVLFLVVSWWPGAASAQAPLLDPALMPRARAEGTVRAIVELGGLNVVPEGSLRDEVSVSAQRRSIGAVQDVVGQALRGMRHRLVRRFETVPLVAIEASPDALRVLESMRGVVLRVYKDAIEAPALAQSGPLVGAPGAWDVGRDGSGTVIAVVDSGVDGNHPFLAGKVIEEACFSSNEPGRSVTVCPNGQETQLGAGAGGPCSIPACDHGTHVAGIAAGA